MNGQKITNLENVSGEWCLRCGVAPSAGLWHLTRHVAWTWLGLILQVKCSRQRARRAAHHKKTLYIYLIQWILKCGSILENYHSKDNSNNDVHICNSNLPYIHTCALVDMHLSIIGNHCKKNYWSGDQLWC